MAQLSELVTWNLPRLRDFLFSQHLDSKQVGFGTVFQLKVCLAHFPFQAHCLYKSGATPPSLRDAFLLIAQVMEDFTHLCTV